MSYTSHRDYKTCNHCGSNYDHNEYCSCQDEDALWCYDPKTQEFILLYKGRETKISLKILYKELIKKENIGVSFEQVLKNIATIKEKNNEARKNN